jgi:hypothetical protein
MNASGFPYTTDDATKMIGNGIKRQVVQRWGRKGEIKGTFQREKNARRRLSAQGVIETWYLWATHSGLDPATDMPPEVKKLHDGSTGPSNAVSENPVIVTLKVPVGVQVQVVHEG